MHPLAVEVIEVGPRDGLQNEAAPVSTEVKAAFIRRAIEAGSRRIEVTSFVSPKRVPQMADAEALLTVLPEKPEVSYIGLVLNRRGCERALAAGVREVNFVVVASDSFSRRNQGVGTVESVAAWGEVSKAAHEAKVKCGVTIAAAFGCPYEQEVPTGRVVELAKRVADYGADEIALADTIGVATPADVAERVHAVSSTLPHVPLRCHFHNTRNTGLANAYAALQAGVSRLDSSIGGIGGCPFAPAATGNIATEDLVYMLQRMHIETGLSLARLIETAHWLEERIGKTVPSMLTKVAPFPGRAAAA